MSSAATDGGSKTTSTSSSTPQPARLPEPRCFILYGSDLLFFLRYYWEVYDPASTVPREDREALVNLMTEDQKKTFPHLTEDFAIIVALYSANEKKQQLDELVRELKLNAENDIDHEGERC